MKCPFCFILGDNLGYGIVDRHIRKEQKQLDMIDICRGELYMKRVESSLDTKQVLTVVERYSQALELLDAYDHQNMIRPKGNKASYILTYEECRKIIL